MCGLMVADGRQKNSAGSKTHLLIGAWVPVFLRLRHIFQKRQGCQDRLAQIFIQQIITLEYSGDRRWPDAICTTLVCLVPELLQIKQTGSVWGTLHLWSSSMTLQTSAAILARKHRQTVVAMDCSLGLGPDRHQQGVINAELSTMIPQLT